MLRLVGAFVAFTGIIYGVMTIPGAVAPFDGLALLRAIGALGASVVLGTVTFVAHLRHLARQEPEVVPAARVVTSSKPH